MDGATRVWRRAVGVTAAALLVTGGLTAVALVVTVTPASAATDLVTTEAQFRTDWNSNSFDTLVLQNDIHLTSPGCTIATRQAAASGPITIDGQGQFKIVQDCPGHGVLLDDANGNATLRGVTITGASNGTEAGGLRFAGTTAATLTITNSTFIDNSTTNKGGAIKLQQPGTLNVANSNFVNNSAVGTGIDGGAIDLDQAATLNVTNSSFVNNSAGDDGGALNCNHPNETMNVTGSTFTGNSTAAGVGNSGGAIDAEEDTGPCTINVVDSTITTSTSGDDAAITAQSTIDTVTIVYSTIVNNATSPASPGPASVPATANGDDSGVGSQREVVGGPPIPVATANLEVVTPANLTVFGTVFGRPHGGPNCSDGNGAPLTGIVDAGYNLADDTSCGLTTATDKQAAGLDPSVGALANNGGPTQTLLPLTGSPLIDAITAAACQTGPATGVTTDQRGVARPQGSGCDIGAVEVVPPLLVPLFTG